MFVLRDEGVKSALTPGLQKIQVKFKNVRDKLQKECDEMKDQGLREQIKVADGVVDEYNQFLAKSNLK